MRKEDLKIRLGREPDGEEIAIFKTQVAIEYNEFKTWMETWYVRISEWPGKVHPHWDVPAIPEFMAV